MFTKKNHSHRAIIGNNKAFHIMDNLITLNRNIFGCRIKASILAFAFLCSSSLY